MLEGDSGVREGGGGASGAKGLRGDGEKELQG